jgi:hypothetical protein
MRRIKLATGAVVAALLLASVTTSAQAAIPPRSTQTVFITVCEAYLAPVIWAGPTGHQPGWWHTGNEFVLVGSEWVLSGTFRVDFTTSNWGVSNGNASGTFQVRDELLGDYDGDWAWNWGLGQDGHGVGQGLMSSGGGHVKIDFLLNDPVGLDWPANWNDWCNGGPMYDYRFLVMSTY